MTPKSKRHKYEEIPPGNYLLYLLDQYGGLNELARHIELRSIIDEHQIMWQEADTVEKKIYAHKRFRKQVALSVTCLGGFEVAVHGAVMSASGQLAAGSSLILVGIAVIYYMRK